MTLTEQVAKNIIKKLVNSDDYRMEIVMLINAEFLQFAIGFFKQVVIARNSKVFIADKLSDTNKQQLDSLNIEWVELRNSHGFRRFKTVLENLDIPHVNYSGENINDDLVQIFQEVFTE